MLPGQDNALCLSLSSGVGAGPVLFGGSVSVPPCVGVCCVPVCVCWAGSAVEVVSLIRCVGMCRDAFLDLKPAMVWFQALTRQEMAPSPPCPRIKQFQFCEREEN